MYIYHIYTEHTSKHPIYTPYTSHIPPPLHYIHIHRHCIWCRYMMFEVLETAWGVFRARMQETEDMDGLIRAHDEYV